jgi:hypothetical protein
MINGIILIPTAGKCDRPYALFATIAIVDPGEAYYNGNIDPNA